MAEQGRRQVLRSRRSHAYRRCKAHRLAVVGSQGKRSEELTGCKLLLSRTGGAHGGGACLTQDAEQILSDFTAFRKEVDTEIEKAFKKYFAN